jgi:hypothetical protein
MSGWISLNLIHRRRRENLEEHESEEGSDKSTSEISRAGERIFAWSKASQLTQSKQKAVLGRFKQGGGNNKGAMAFRRGKLAVRREKSLNGRKPWTRLQDETSLWRQHSEKTVERLRKPEDGTV